MNPEPVGSRTISKNSNLGVSAATIRNEMSDLEDLELLKSLMLLLEEFLQKWDTSYMWKKL